MLLLKKVNLLFTNKLTSIFGLLERKAFKNISNSNDGSFAWNHYCSGLLA